MLKNITADKVLSFFGNVYVFIFVMLLSLPVWAEQTTFPEPLPAGVFTLDEAQIIDEKTIAWINDIGPFMAGEDMPTAPIFVVTIPSLQSYGAENIGVEQYTNALFNTWQLDNRGYKYGVLMLISKEDRQAHITLGGQYPAQYNNEVREVVKQFVSPRLQQGNFEEAAFKGVDKIVGVLLGRGVVSDDFPVAGFKIVSILGLAIIAILVLIYRRIKKKMGKR